MNLSSSPLMDAKTLNKLMAKNEITVIDATWFMPHDERTGEQSHRQCCIPTARFFDIDVIKDRDNPLPHMLPDGDSFTQTMNEMGVSFDDTIVVYDAVGTWSSPRVWWHFRAYGHKNTYILHGGLPSWKNDGFATARGENSVISKVTSSWRDERHHHRIAYEELLSLVGEEAVHVVDARPAGRFSGRDAEPRSELRSGHMPCSTNVPYHRLLTDNGLYYREDDELRGLLHDALHADDPVVTSCGSGVTACIVAAALAHLGKWDVRVFDGSWAEWGGRLDAPILADT